MASKACPWNRLSTRDRKNGAYYKEGFRRVKSSSRGGLVSITSFNEWGEGTQIEPAVPKISLSTTYLDYSPGRPEFYLQLTRDMAEELPTDCGITWCVLFIPLLTSASYANLGLWVGSWLINLSYLADQVVVLSYRQQWVSSTDSIFIQISSSKSETWL